ncbi:MAG: flagellar basal body P-ring formation protein FlgA [Alphaproteobacteria bacterium]|nr:flagellar basal body P-ring formation protein FlgA [Alphaproteobacteria bacterium]
MKKFVLSFAIGLLAITNSVYAEQAISITENVQIAPAPVSLNRMVTVEGQHVLLGDIFNNISENTEQPVAFAPKAGKKSIFEMKWLYRTARSYNIDWKPISKFDRVTVKRASQIIDNETIKEKLHEALTFHGVSSDAEVAINKRSTIIHAPIDIEPKITINNVSYNKRLRRFTAVAEILVGTPDAFQMYLRGKVFETTVIPVVLDNMPQGELITAKDIKMITIRTDQLRHNSITDSTQLIGKEVRRMIRSGTIIQMSNVQNPIMVSKGRMVTMFLKTPFMTLTTRGKALENGSDGDIIRIQNIKSKTIVQGTVTGADEITVSIAETTLAMNRM